MLINELTKIKKVLLNRYPETSGNIDHIFDNGDTLLMKALKSKNKILIYNILKYQAARNHNVSNKNGYTALIYASKFGFFDIVKLLVEKYNVDIFKLTKKCKKASDICDCQEIIDYLQKTEKIQYSKADIEYKNQKCRELELPDDSD